MKRDVFINIIIIVAASLEGLHLINLFNNWNYRWQRFFKGTICNIWPEFEGTSNKTGERPQTILAPQLTELWPGEGGVAGAQLSRAKTAWKRLEQWTIWASRGFIRWDGPGLAG